MKEFILKIITPDRVFFEGPVTAVELNTTEGQIGVLPGHVPMTVIVKPGILTIYEEEQMRIAALHAGFAEILKEQITILAEVIEWPEEIDEERALAARERAGERLRVKAPGTDVARAEIAMLRAMTRINVLK